MVVYRMDFSDPDNGSHVEWHSAKADAVRQLKHLQEQRGCCAMGPEGVSRVYIPTDKYGLIRWLNCHLHKDNG
jgi:hypothetical protein